MSKLKCELLEIDKYFERIGYKGSKSCNLTTLRQLCKCHATTVPFDNLDMHGGPRKTLDLNKIYNDIVVECRGGFCYERNGLFGSLLEALGYKIEILEGSCFMSGCDEFSFPFNHLLLMVIIDEVPWIVDVGYGITSFFEPMKFELLTPQTQGTGIYRFRKPMKNVYYVEKQKKKVLTMESSEEVHSKKNVGKSKYSVDDGWTILFQFSDKYYTWEDFFEACDEHVTDEDGYYKTNSFVQIFHEKGALNLWGTKLIEIEYLDPLTEKIKFTEIMPSYTNIQAENSTTHEKETMILLLKSKFGIELNFWPAFKAFNYYHGEIA